MHRHRQPEPEPVPYAQMPLDTLLLPPLLTSRTPWTRGIFLTIAHRDLVPGERHPCNYFLDLTKGIIVDENGEPAPGHEAMGNWGLGSFRSADDAISRALGVPLAAN